MAKWQYTHTETIEIEVPDSVGSAQDAFLDWLASYEGAELAPSIVVDSFVGEAHKLEDEGNEGQDRKSYSDTQDRDSYLDNYMHDSDMEDH